MEEDKNRVLKAILEICIMIMVDVCLVFFLMKAYTTSYRFSYELFSDYPVMAASKAVYDITIETGMSPKEIAFILESNGIVSSEEIFLARVYLGKYSKKIIAGTYSLGPAMSPDEICRKICKMQSGGT